MPDILPSYYKANIFYYDVTNPYYDQPRIYDVTKLYTITSLILLLYYH